LLRGRQAGTLARIFETLDCWDYRHHVVTLD
jgi:hypothetical protein